MNKILLTDGQFWILKCRGGGGGVVRKVSFLEREFKALYPSLRRGGGENLNYTTFIKFVVLLDFQKLLK